MIRAPAALGLMVTVLMATAAEAAGEIRLRPGDHIQAAIDAAPPGAVFVLAPGVYRQQSFAPKARQSFVGEAGAVLNGAMLLTGWRRSGAHWVAEGLPGPLRLHGFCEETAPLCRAREDLFLDGRLLPRVASLGELRPGTWFADRRRAYLADSPEGRTVELSVTPEAIGGRAEGVTLRNLVVEKYAPAAQSSAIEASDGRAWQVLGVTARWNHGIGLRLGPEIVVRGGSYSDNGQMGMGGEGDGGLVEGVEIARNNYAGYSKGWEAGGAKFVRSDGLVVRGACVHRNDGVGLWLDIDNVDITLEDNLVFDNSRAGISHEISFKAAIRNNRVAGNGRARDVWLWGAQILVQNSQDVEVTGNWVEVAAEGGNGIGLIYQDRRKDGSGPYLTRNNVVRGNHVVMLGSAGRSGIVADFEVERFWREQTNRFEANTYYSQHRFAKHWDFGGEWLSWLWMRWRGLEPSGSLIIGPRPSMKLACEQRG